MKERPILFSAPMVRALLDGSKTQTRRVCKPAEGLSYVVAVQDPNERGQRPPYFTPGWFGDEEGEVQFLCPYGQPGDRLWVREAWAPGDNIVFGSKKDDPETVCYRADKAALGWDGQAMATRYDTYAFNWDSVKWKPSIHMPRWASRITLEIVSVRVERLQDISRGDAMAEGCPFPNMAQGDDPRQWYADLWGQINGPGSWDLNPWVWVIEFKRVKS